MNQRDAPGAEVGTHRAVLLTAGRHKETEEVYRRDLEKWPETGRRCMVSAGAAGQSAESAKV